MRPHPNAKAERYRLAVEGGEWAVGSNNGVFGVPSPEGPFKLNVWASNGGGWDHVSVSLNNRTPTWREMVHVKDLFFADEEVAMQLHPAKAEYVNHHPFCLHIWRPQTEAERTALIQAHGEQEVSWPTPGPIPLPPIAAVGPVRSLGQEKPTMSKKKSKPEPKPVAKPKGTTCFRCDGTAELCNGCGESAAHCTDNCPDDDGNEQGYYECPDCKGTGK
jgi:hypothetical protein